MVLLMALFLAAAEAAPAPPAPGTPWWVPALLGVLGPALGQLALKLLGAGMASRQRDKERKEADRDKMIRMEDELKQLRDQVNK